MGVAITFVLTGISKITNVLVPIDGNYANTVTLTEGTTKINNVTSTQKITLPKAKSNYSLVTGYGYPVVWNYKDKALTLLSTGNTSTASNNETPAVENINTTIYIRATGIKTKVDISTAVKSATIVYAPATTGSHNSGVQFSSDSTIILQPSTKIYLKSITFKDGQYPVTLSYSTDSYTYTSSSDLNDPTKGVSSGAMTTSQRTLTVAATPLPKYDYSWQVYTYVDGVLIGNAQKDSAQTTSSTYNLNLFSYITVTASTYDYNGYATTLTGTKVNSSSVILNPSDSLQTFYVFFSTKVTYHTVTINLPTAGINSYYVTYTTVDGTPFTNVKAESNKFFVQIGSTFKIESVNYSKGYEKSGDGAGTTLKNIKENKTITLGVAPKKFKLTIYHCDTDGTQLLSYATKKEYTIQDSISLAKISEDIGGWQAIGYTFDDEDFDSLSTGPFDIDEPTTVYVVYNNPPISFTATKSTTKNTISISNIKNGASPYSYTVACYDTDGTFLLGGKTFTSNSTVLPYGYKYKVTIVDADGDTASSDFIEMDKFAPSISHTQANDGYTITFTANYTNSSGYTSIKFDDAEKYVTNKSFSKAYDTPGEKTVSFQFRGVWSPYTNTAGQIEYTYITYTINYKFTVEPRYQYIYSSSCYRAYNDNGEQKDTLVKSFDTGGIAYSNSRIVYRPTYEAYPTYLGYTMGTTSKNDTYVELPEDINTVSVITWRYRIDTYPYEIYSIREGSAREDPLTGYANTSNQIPINTMDARARIYNYKINNNSPVTPGNYSGDTITVTLATSYKNKLTKITVNYAKEMKWLYDNPDDDNDTPGWGTIRDAQQYLHTTIGWANGVLPQTLTYWTDDSKKHKIDIKQYTDSVLSQTIYYYNSVKHSYFPGGYTWKAEVVDALNRKISTSKTFAAPPKPDILWTTADATGKQINGLKITISDRSNTSGYQDIKIYYKRKKDTLWLTETIQTSSDTIIYYIDIGAKGIGIDTFTTEETIGYEAYAVYTNSEVRINGATYEYTYSDLFNMDLAYPVKVTLHEHVHSITLASYDEYDDFRNDRTYHNINEAIGLHTVSFHVKANTYLGYTGYVLSPGYNGLDYSYNDCIEKYINNHSGNWINGPKEFHIRYLNAPQVYEPYIGLGDTLESVTIGYFASDKDNSWQEISITNHDELTQIQTSQADSYIRLIEYKTKDSADYFNHNSFSPASDNTIDGYECYNAFYYIDSPLIFSIERKKIQVNTDSEAFTTSCDFEYVNSTGGNAIAANNTSIIERTSKTSGNNFVRINSYSLRLYRKNIYLQETDTGNIILPNSTSGLYELQWDKGYMITAESYQKPKMELTADKYSITCTFSDIDEDAYIKTHTGHMLTIKKKGENTPIGQYPLSFSKTTHSVTYTDTTIYPYLIQAETTYTITFVPFDKIQNDSIEDSSVTDSITTLNRQTPTFTIPSNDKIGNRFTATLDNYEDYNTVWEYEWASDKDFNQGQAIFVLNNLSENVSSTYVPSDSTNFELDKDYYITITLRATDGSMTFWTCEGDGVNYLKFHTPAAYTLNLNLKNINKIKAKSGSNSTEQIYNNGSSIPVIPNDTFTITNVEEYATLTTPNPNRTMLYKSPVTYQLLNGSDILQKGNFINGNNVSQISYQMTNSTPALTLILKATPADWVWPSGYTADTTPEGQTPILTAGIPTTDFKHQVWNELMFYLKKWSEYKSLTEAYVYSAMSEGDTTLTVERYKNALARLNLLFNALSDVIGIPTQGQTPLTAKGLQAFGDSIKYDNLKE